MKTFAVAAAPILGALALAAGLNAGPSQAQTAARVESQTRPNFGLLLDPPTQSRPRSHRGWSSRWRPRPQPGPVQPPFAVHPSGTEEVVLVDCGGNSGTGAVEAAVRRLRPGGSLILRSTAGPCAGLLQIDKPLTVIGDAGLDPRNWDRDAAPTLQAPDGSPCVVVSPGVRVTFRDVVFAAPRAGGSPCIVGYDAEILLNRVGVRYAGDRPAIFAEGGLLDLRDVDVRADTVSPGIVADGASVNADEVWVTDAVAGIEITAGDGPISRLNRVRLVARRDQGSFGPRPVGLSILASRSQDLVRVSNSKICGYPDGVILEGAKFHIDYSRICGTVQAVTVHGGEALIENSRIVASETGVFADAGTVTLRNTVFAGYARPTESRRSGLIIPENNHVWTAGQECGPSYRPIYGNRHFPVWNSPPPPGYNVPYLGGGFICHNTPYPRTWWQQDEAELGVPYDARVNWPDGLTNFERGRGWYDCRGRYVDSTRYFDDDRWRRGGLGFTRDCPRPSGYSPRSASVDWPSSIWVEEFDLDFGGPYAIGD